MADADEDSISLFPSGAQSDPIDLEDEAQDFRFLAHLIAPSSGSAEPTIPKRGTKDFEPNPTRSQTSALDASRYAMQIALSVERVHVPKNHVIGQYVSKEQEWWGRDGERKERCVWVHKMRSTHGKVMGQDDRWHRNWFLPEEALYLLERGTLDVRWEDEDEEDVTELVKETVKEQEVLDDVNQEGDDDKIEDSEADPSDVLEPKSDSGPAFSLTPGSLPMSLQGAYASFIGKSGLTLERYQVYANLKRAGYVVQRAPTWHDQDINPNSLSLRFTSPPTDTTSLIATTSPSLIHRLLSWLLRPSHTPTCPAYGPLVAPGLHRSYNDIFRALTLIPYHQTPPIASPTIKPQPAAPFRLTYNVWKPNSAYKKSLPPAPDFRVVVCDGRTTSMPTLSQIGELLDSVPPDELKEGMRLENKIRQGKRNVVLAVVDRGVVSYLRFGDCESGGYRLFEEKARGGRGRGRGAGRGRGRGGRR